MSRLRGRARRHPAAAGNTVSRRTAEAAASRVGDPGAPEYEAGRTRVLLAQIVRLPPTGPLTWWGVRGRVGDRCRDDHDLPQSAGAGRTPGPGPPELSELPRATVRPPPGHRLRPPAGPPGS